MFTLASWLPFIMEVMALWRNVCNRTVIHGPIGLFHQGSFHVSTILIARSVCYVILAIKSDRTSSASINKAYAKYLMAYADFQFCFVFVFLRKKGWKTLLSSHSTIHGNKLLCLFVKKIKHNELQLYCGKQNPYLCTLYTYMHTNIVTCLVSRKCTCDSGRPSAVVVVDAAGNH